MDKLSIVLRVLDNENRLLERADQKAISMLSILGVFMVFFIVYYRLIPVNILTILLSTAYFIFAFLAIFNLIMAMRPRIRQGGQDDDLGNDPPPSEPAFFQGICKFPNLSAYRQGLETMTRDEESAINVYTRQIYSVAQINAAKYKYAQRGILIGIFTLATELAIIVYLFISHFEAGSFPPI